MTQPLDNWALDNPFSQGIKETEVNFTGSFQH